MTIEAKPGTAAETPDPAEDAPERRRPQGLHGIRRPLSFGLALLFFFGPALAFTLGARPQEIENRRLAELPSASAGWGFFPAFSTWATDHLPLRKQAVNGNAAMSEGIFGEPPSYGGGDGTGVAGVPGTGPGSDEEADPVDAKYPAVLGGKDGWLYYGGDVSGACRPERTVDDTVARLSRLASIIQSSGRRFVFVIAPDKSTVWPQQLPDKYLGKACSQARHAEFWQKLQASPPPGYVDLRSIIEADQKATGQPLYRQTDTHWGQKGALLYTKSLADALRPGLWSSLVVQQGGTIKRTGDLGVLTGQPHADEIPGYTLSRPGKAWDYAMPGMPLGLPVKVESGPKPPGVPLIGERTLLLGDSFSNSSTTMLPRLFTRLTILHNEVAAPHPEVSAAAIADAQTVVYEIVERNLASGQGALLDDAALSAITKAVAARPR